MSQEDQFELIKLGSHQPPNYKHTFKDGKKLGTSLLNQSVKKLLNYLESHDLTSLYSELTKLLKIVLTTSVHTSEPERLFSTLARIKDATRNAMGQSRLNALTALSVHSQYFDNYKDFNNEVIEMFANKKTETNGPDI